MSIRGTILMRKREPRPREGLIWLGRDLYCRGGLCPWVLQRHAWTWLRSYEAHVHHCGDVPVLVALTDVESRGLGGVNQGAISPRLTV
jgi:hypothetical protein